MKTKRLILFTVVLAVLGALAFWKQGGLQKESEQPESIFSDFKPAEALQVQIKKQDKATVLIKKDDRWFVTEKEKPYRAVHDFIEGLLSKLSLVQSDRVASRQKEKHALFEVNAEKGLGVKILGKDEKVLSHFYLGKQGPDGMGNYLRLNDSDEVLVVGENLSYIFGRRDWRERKVFQPKVEDIKKLVLSYPQEEIILVQDKEKGWQLQAPQAGTASDEEVTNLFSTLTSLRIVQFVEGAVKESETGLNTPDLKISWDLESEEQGALLIGKPKGGLRYAQQAGGDNVVLVPESRIKSLWEQTDKLKQPIVEAKEAEKISEKNKTDQATEQKSLNKSEGRPIPPAKK